MKAQAKTIKATVVEHVGMLRSEFGVEVGPCCRLRFEDGSQDDITYKALARFVADGTFELCWEIPQPTDFNAARTTVAAGPARG